VVHLRIDSIQDKRGQFCRSPWYASAEAGRTALVGTGIHEVDLVRYFVARPILSVCAFSNHLGTLEFPADTTTPALFHFEGGATGQVTVSYQAHLPPGEYLDDQLLLIASNGLIAGAKVACDGEADWQLIPPEPGAIVTGTRGCVNAFVRSILTGEPVPIDGREAFASLAACVAADLSASTGQPTAPEGIGF
jgi:predicted dehydrogenase